MQKQRVSYLVALGTVLCIAMASFLGCSPQRRYEVLSFFFDGVPNPQSGNVALGAGGRPISYLHKPYSEGKCAACHTDGDAEMSITRAIDIKSISSKVCLKCHEKTPNQYPFMHGPVAVGECMLCHAPHESPNPHLLLAATPRLCVQCHVPELMSPKRPEHADEKADCLNCHVGHGSGARGLLRVKAPAATRPAVSTAETSASTRPAAADTGTLPATRPAAPIAGRPATSQPAVTEVAAPVAEGGV